MKNTLKFILALAALTLVGLPCVNAQNNPPAQGQRGGGRQQMTPEQRIEALEKAVGTLTAEQKTKITDIITKTQEQLKALSQEDARTKGREIRTAERTKIREVLTAEQQKKFDEMPQRGPGGGQRGQGGQGGARQGGN